MGADQGIYDDRIRRHIRPRDRGSDKLFHDAPRCLRRLDPGRGHGLDTGSPNRLTLGPAS